VSSQEALRSRLYHHHHPFLLRLFCFLQHLARRFIFLFLFFPGGVFSGRGDGGKALHGMGEMETCIFNRSIGGCNVGAPGVSVPTDDKSTPTHVSQSTACIESSDEKEDWFRLVFPSRGWRAATWSARLHMACV
jgi:hypothetical protein